MSGLTCVLLKYHETPACVRQESCVSLKEKCQLLIPVCLVADICDLQLLESCGGKNKQNFPLLSVLKSFASINVNVNVVTVGLLVKPGLYAYYNKNV